MYVKKVQNRKLGDREIRRWGDKEIREIGIGR